MRSKNIVFILFLTVIIGLGSCTHSPVYDHQYKLSKSVWTYDNKLHFQSGVEDTTANYDVKLKLKYSKNYPFQNLYLSIAYDLPEQGTLKDTLNLVLIDRKGFWKGKCGKESCVYLITLLENVELSEETSSTFMLEQLTRMDSLPGIEELGLVIMKSK